MTGRDAARDELAKAIWSGGLSGQFGYSADMHFAECIADALVHLGYRRSVTPDQREAAAKAIDERLRPYTGALSGNQALGAADVAARAFGLEVTE